MVGRADPQNLQWIPIIRMMPLQPFGARASVRLAVLRDLSFAVLDRSSQYPSSSCGFWISRTPRTHSRAVRGAAMGLCSIALLCVALFLGLLGALLYPLGLQAGSAILAKSGLRQPVRREFGGRLFLATSSTPELGWCGSRSCQRFSVSALPCLTL